MRLAGTLTNQADAQRLVDYLLTQGIEARVDLAEQGFAVWVRNDDHLQRAREELDQYVAHPDDARYQAAAGDAGRLRRQQQAHQAATRKNLIDARSIWQKPNWRQCPVTLALTIACLVIFTICLFPKFEEPLRNLLFIAPVEHEGNFIRYYPDLREVRQGQVWRLFTPMLMHAPPFRGVGFLHILFNLLWLQMLGRQIEARRGSLLFLLLVLAIGGLSNVVQFYTSGPLFYGMSGVVYGLFGYVWISMRWVPNSQLWIDRTNVQLMLAWFVLCWLGLVGSVANTAHSVGLAVGVAAALLALVPRWWRKLMRRG